MIQRHQELAKECGVLEGIYYLKTSAWCCASLSTRQWISWDGQVKFDGTRIRNGHV